MKETVLGEQSLRTVDCYIRHSNSVSRQAACAHAGILNSTINKQVPLR